MNGYELSIINEKEMIEFSTREFKDGAPITSAEFRMNTINNNTLAASSARRVELTIKGNITEDNREETVKLAKWSMDLDKNTLYRDVELTVYSTQNCTGEIMRVYKFANMFVVDYTETFEKIEEGELGTFVLFIAQKEGNEKREISDGN